MEPTTTMKQSTELLVLRASLDLLKRIIRFGSIEVYEFAKFKVQKNPSEDEINEPTQQIIEKANATRHVFTTVLNIIGVPVYHEGQVAVQKAKVDGDTVESDNTFTTDALLVTSTFGVSFGGELAGKISVIDPMFVECDRDGKVDISSPIFIFHPIYADDLATAETILGRMHSAVTRLESLHVLPIMPNSRRFIHKFGFVDTIQHMDAETVFLVIEQWLLKAQQLAGVSAGAPTKNIEIPAQFIVTATSNWSCKQYTVANSRDSLPRELHLLLNTSCSATFESCVQNASRLIAYLEDIHEWSTKFSNFVDATSSPGRCLEVDYFKDEDEGTDLYESVAYMLSYTRPVFCHPGKYFKHKRSI